MANAADTPLKILLAYDGSQHALAAVELLKGFTCQALSSKGTPLQVQALAVMPSQWIGGHEALAASLENIAENLRTCGAQVKAEIKAGNPAATINEYATNLKVDLIIVGAQGLRATLGILLGGVAQQVVEYSRCPVLVIRAPFQVFQNVLLVTDGSPESTKAVRFLADVQRRGLPLLPSPEENPPEVTVMHVVPPVISPEMAMRTWAVGPEAIYPIPISPVDMAASEQEVKAQGERILKEAVEMLAQAGIRAHMLLHQGDAATEILQFTREHKVDLVVCGSRGLSSITGWLLGSVSRKLVHYANCSVLIVK